MSKRKSSAGQSDKPHLKVNQKPLGNGIRLTSQSRRVIDSFFEREKSEGRSVNRLRVTECTSMATGVSVRTVHEIHRESVANGLFFIPTKRYAKNRIKVNPDSFDREVIRRIVHSFYERKEYPTLSKVLERVKEECSFPEDKFCLSCVIHELGFSYKQRNMKQYVYEQHNVLEQRHTYLQTIRNYGLTTGNLCTCMDETWVNAHHTNNYIWVDSDGKGGWKVPSGKGQRLIIVHVGSAEGWVEGADLVFKSKTKSADYHDEMNSEHYPP